MFRPLIGALHEELRAVLADNLHAALDRAVGMADVAVLHPESSDSLSVIVRPMGRERDADVPDRALVARGAVGPARFRFRRGGACAALRARRESGHGGRQRRRSQTLKVVQDSRDERFDQFASLLRRRERRIAERAGRRVRSRRAAPPRKWPRRRRRRVVVPDGFRHVHRRRVDVQHHRRFDFIRVGAAGLLLEAPRGGRELRVDVRELQQDAIRHERVGRLLKRLHRREARVEDVEPARPRARDGADGFHRQAPRRRERQRRGAGILDERGIEMIGQRRRDDDLRGQEDAGGEVVRKPLIRVQFQVLAMFDRAGPEWKDDNRRNVEQRLRLDP